MKNQTNYFRTLMPEFRKMRDQGYEKQDIKYYLDVARGMYRGGYSPEDIREMIKPDNIGGVTIDPSIEGALYFTAAVLSAPAILGLTALINFGKIDHAIPLAITMPFAIIGFGWVNSLRED